MLHQMHVLGTAIISTLLLNLKIAIVYFLFKYFLDGAIAFERCANTSVLKSFQYIYTLNTQMWQHCGLDHGKASLSTNWTKRAFFFPSFPVVLGTPVSPDTLVKEVAASLQSARGQEESSTLMREDVARGDLVLMVCSFLYPESNVMSSKSPDTI